MSDFPRPLIYPALALLSALMILSIWQDSAHSQSAEALADPIPGRIEKSGLTVRLEDFVQVPRSSQQRPFTRISHLMAAPDDSGRLFVSDLRGIIYIIKDGVLLAAPFLDVATTRAPVLEFRVFEKGLTAFAFHPDYGKPERAGYGKLYTATSETVDPDYAELDTIVMSSPSGTTRHHVVIAEWSADPALPDRVDSGSRREVLRVAFEHGDHQIEQLGFRPNIGPDDPGYGLMYIGVGDGGNTALWSPEVDLDRQGQNTSTPFGALIRINPLQNDRQQYSVSIDNPFLTSTTPMLPEIWAYGFRNPQRFSWDTDGDGTMFIADIGQTNIEEINIGRVGANYGWSEREGRFAVDHLDQSHVLPLPAGDKRNGYTYPIAQYDHDEGIAVTGGYVYRGDEVGTLEGMYVFGDIVNGRIFYFDADDIEGGQSHEIKELRLIHDGVEKSLLDIVGNVGRADLRFGMDGAGEIYVLTKQDGMIRKIVARSSGRAGVRSISSLFSYFAAAILTLLAGIGLHAYKGRRNA